MLEFYPLVEAWKDPKIGEILKKSFIRYSSSCDVVAIDSYNEGEKKQFFPKEAVDGWYPWVREDKNGKVLGNYLVASNSIGNVSFTRNSDGWIRVKENSWTLAHGFNNAKIGAMGVPLTFEIYDALPEHLKVIASDCWILKDKKAKVKRNADMYFLRNGRIESISAYYSYEGVCIATREFLPIIELPKNVLIKVGENIKNGKKSAGALRIKLPD